MTFISLPSPRLTIAAVLFIAVFALSACTYKERVSPIQMPESAENVVEFENGLKVTARAFTDKQTASESFGFNIRKAGILPVQITFQNDSEDKVTIQPGQTFLIDEKNQAWPLLSQDQTYKRAKKHVEVGETVKGAAVPSLLLGSAGAVAGAAIGIVSGSNIGEAMGKGAAVGAAAGAVSGGAKTYAETGRKIREDIKSKSLGNEAIQPGYLSYGILFFPGTPEEEAQSASRLRLSLEMGTRQELVVINLK